MKGGLRSRIDRVTAQAGRPDAAAGLGQAEPLDERDLLLALQAVHELHMAPLSRLKSRAAWQHDPAIAGLKQRLEQRFLADVRRRAAGWLQDDVERLDKSDAVATIRALVARELVPPVYDWIAGEADAEEIRWFLSLEGGPDADFDDLVALCQVGLDGEPKLELGTNYWDEMGNGEAAAVHTELYRRLVADQDLASFPSSEVPLEALRRSTLGAVLATNRFLQPELVGALGTIEMQAGPRCRRVIQGLERIGAGEESLAFYREHAEADPRHGRNWLKRVIEPLAEDPWWAAGMVRGAAFRCALNHEFFAALDRRRHAAVEELRRVA